MDQELDARRQAQATWDARACGELEGDKDSVAYFDSVAATRYAAQPWAKGYFGYAASKGKSVLEVGIGQGTDLVNFAQAGAVCHGLDITDNHLQLTGLNFRLRGLDVDLRKGDATAIPFADNTFDIVYSFGVIHHIPDVQKVVSEIRRVLKPGGMFCVAVYSKWSAFHIFQKIIANGLVHGELFTKGYDGLLATIETGADGVNLKPYVKLYTKSSLRNLLCEFEIDDLSIHQLHHDHFWPAFLQRAVRPLVPALDSTLGWYVAARARKPGAPPVAAR